MEDIPYFDAFYACFLTYSASGFGDIFVNTVENTVKLRVCVLYFGKVLVNDKSMNIWI